MPFHRLPRTWLAGLLGGCLLTQAGGPESAASAPARFANAPALSDPGFFPIAVWLQNPSRAAAYRKAGFNLYVGLWRGPTEDQLAALKAAGLRVICDQNAVGLRHRDDPTILGWMHGDEPDNAQRRPDGQGYGPPIPPERIVADYRRLRAADPTRPVLLNLGQGVAWDGWRGRGVRTAHPEDYAEYVQGGDIVSFDIYPACHRSPEVAGKLWYVARGVERLSAWAGPGRRVWNCIECTHIQNPDARATPEQVRAEVWMSLIHGSRGLIYFVHEWQPRFNEAALLDDPAMLAMVTRINRRIASLARVLNAPSTPELARVEAAPSGRIAMMVKHVGGTLHLFAVEMRGQPARATFRTPEIPGGRDVEVLGENRRLPLKDGGFRDSFRPWQVHLYRMTAEPGSTGTR